jgi:hypothetical protein
LQLHASSLQCPCTELSFSYEDLIHLEPEYHQICSSDFIDTDRLNILFTSYQNQNASETNLYTFTGTAFAYFQSLSIMCELTKQAVIDAQDLFLGTPVVSAYMLDYDLFDEQTNAALTSYKSTLSNSFVHKLQILLGMAHCIRLFNKLGCIST